MYNISKNIWEHNKKVGQSLQNFAKRPISKALLFLLLATGAVYFTNRGSDNSNGQQQHIQLMSDEKKAFREDPIFFDTNLKYKDERLNSGVYIRRDAKGAFYKVQEGDNLSKIRAKLMQIPEFSYLHRTEYDPSIPANKTHSFNIPGESLKIGMRIPIPWDSYFREISVQSFLEFAEQGVMQMQSDPQYGAVVKELLQRVDIKDVVVSIVTFARCETAEDHKYFSDPIGSTEYYRREPRYHAFSFTAYHLLMEKDGPGLQARKNLQISEMQAYHPLNATKIFLGYCIEKTHGKPRKLLDINQKTLHAVSRAYNGSGYRANNYHTKLRNNYTYIQKIQNNEIKTYDFPILAQNGLKHGGVNSTGKNVFMCNCPDNITVASLRVQLMHKINDLQVQKVSLQDVLIVDAKGNALADNVSLASNKKIYILLP